ncbi:MAG: GcrA cell cycle regulator [Methylobacteriaceae bacterium]|nr:GcrA cell cycle regulator [Methylobacteriaceae bacterium]
MSWTDERVELLRKLWGEGLSASQIAGQLGAGITRNAVIGKVHRLGLCGRAKAPSNSSPRARPKASRSAQPRPSGALIRGNTALAIATHVVARPAPRPVEEVIVPLSERVTIMDLRDTMCRWPMGDPAQPEFRYCGAKAPSGAPYCDGHRRIAYQPAQERRRERDRERRMLRLT